MITMALRKDIAEQLGISERERLRYNKERKDGVSPKEFSCEQVYTGKGIEYHPRGSRPNSVNDPMFFGNSATRILPVK